MVYSTRRLAWELPIEEAVTSTGVHCRRCRKNIEWASNRLCKVFVRCWGFVLGHNYVHKFKSLQEIRGAGEASFMYSTSIATYRSTMMNLRAAAGTSTRVLVVDDDFDTTELLKIVLEPNAFEVIAVNSGQEGIELARKTNPDVMVVDLLMPGTDGMKVCREVRRFSKFPFWC